MNRLLARLWRAGLLLGLALAGSAAAAHEMSMAEMQLREISHGEFIWVWAASEKRGTLDDLHPVWPEGCRADDSTLHCGQEGLSGSLRIDGVGKSYSAALVKIFWLDGKTQVYTVTAAQPSVHLYGSSSDQRGITEIAYAYTVLGVEHILTGVDHLLFVIGLLFLVGFSKRLVWTVSAFTLAHSLTLASSALGWLVLRPPPVEATIALSIVLVAGEALHQRQTLARRWPALLAFLFGLVHGLGFAGALKEIGLPENNLLVALLTFNVGVELGQLLTLGAAYGLWRACAGLPQLARLRSVLLYGIGSVAAYWSWLRVVTIFS